MRKTHRNKTARFSPGCSYTENKKEYMRLYMAWYTQDEMKRLIILHGSSCNKCSSTFRLQFAHLEPTKLKGGGRGKYARVRDIKKNPRKYILLCYGCHRTMDKANGTWCNKHNYNQGLKG